MVLDLLWRIFGGKRDVAEFSALRPGRVIAHGTIKGGDELVRSPLKGLSCVAFYYRAFYKAQARGKWVDRVMREAEVYAPAFALQMEGGVLRVLPPKSAKFEASEHRELLGRGFKGFQASEQVIRPGSRVKLHGLVVRDGESFVLRLTRIDLPGEEEEEGPYRRPEKRRKKRKMR
jgi:hypothetical protein